MGSSTSSKRASDRTGEGRPRCIAIIPARGGSRRLPRKNLLSIAGVPLVAHSIRHARAAKAVQEVLVSTDSDEIAAVASREGAEVVRRPAALATETATSESALLHALDWRRDRGEPDPDLVVFLQCTSPVRAPHDIDAAVAMLRDAGADSLLSVCESTRFLWELRPSKQPRSINYDYLRRQREQDLAQQFQENGSIYVFKPKILRRENNRLGGRIALYTMDYWSSFQIDTEEDLDLCRWILARRGATAPSATWPDPVRLVVFDFDGVMTDNRLVVNEDGSEAVLCSRADGLGLEMLRAAGIPVLVLSKEMNAVVARRCEKLQVPCAQGIDNKAAFLIRYLSERDLPAEGVVYLGNDVNDLECLRTVGLPVVVADADPAVLSSARIVLTRPGGRGAVRELCELVLQRIAARATALREAVEP